MRRRFTLLVTVGILIGLMAVPAAADAPVVFGPFEFGFDSIDPCTGEEHSGTVYGTFHGHFDHNNNFVLRVDETGTTDSGYVLLSGHVRDVETNNGVTFRLKEIWRNPDSGAMYEYSEVGRIVGNSVELDEVGERCVTGSTI